MPTAEATKPKIVLAHRRVIIEADNNGQLPERIELVKAGTWPQDSNKGELKITLADLQEMKANFDAGIGLPKGLNKLAIDFMHEDWAEAAIWIGSMEVEGKTLYGGNLEYTTKGRDALLGGMFKCFSPSFYPSCLGSWHDPEDWSITAKNVIVGGALTNIPFFKSLKPIMASHSSQEENEEILFVDADSERSNMPTLEEVRVKAAAELTDEEKTLLVENVAQLTADEKVKFGLATPEPTPAPAPVAADNKIEATAEEQKILADIRAGKSVLVDADAHKALENKVEAMSKQLEDSRAKEVKTAVQAHVARGAIKADTADKWEARVMADSSVLEDLSALPENKELMQEIGSSNGVTASAADEVRSEAAKLIKAAKENEQVLPEYEAISRVLANNSDLANRYNEEVRGEA